MNENGRRDGRWPPGTFLASLPVELQTRLLSCGEQRTVGRDTVLMREGEPGHRVFLVLRGGVKVTSSSGGGQNVLLAVRLTGDLIGELAVLDNGTRSATATAATTTTLRVINAAEFRTFLAEDSQAAAVVQRSVVAKLRQATRFRVDMSRSSVLVRTARVLDQLSNSYGRRTPHGVVIDIALTQSEIADLLGVGDKSLQRALGELRAKEIIRTAHRQIIVLDADGLRDVLESAQ